MQIKSAFKKIEQDWKYPSIDYRDIAMTDRLEIAEKVYKSIGQDDYFWSEFYRIKAYWFGISKNERIATASRRKAINYSQKVLDMPEYAPQKKETLVIIAAMYFHLEQSDSCLSYLNKAQKLIYRNPEFDPEDEKANNEYIDNLIQEFVNKIDTKESIN